MSSNAHNTHRSDSRSGNRRFLGRHAITVSKTRNAKTAANAISAQPGVNTLFGIEFNDDVMCAVDKLEKDYALKEVNSHDLLTETADRDVQSHRKEKFSGRKVDSNPRGSCSRKTSMSDVGRLKPVEEAMSLTVIKGHEREKGTSYTHDEAASQDAVCTWNSPLLVSTPVVVSKRRIADENIANSIDANVAATDIEMAVTPKQLNYARKSKGKKVEKTKLFSPVVNVRSASESTCVLNKSQLRDSSGRHNILADEREISTLAVSNPDSKSWFVSFLLCFQLAVFEIILVSDQLNMRLPTIS